MTKIGKKPILVPAGVNIDIHGESIQVQGKKGKVSLIIPQGIKVERRGDQLIVNQEDDSRQARALRGTIRQLISNMVTGVQQEWVRRLKVVGTGYTASLSGENLILDVGFSHTITVAPPEGIRFEVDKKNIVQVAGCDRALVGKVAAEIRNLHAPDAYKGKGIRYEDEVIKLKPGKAAKAGEGAGVSVAKS